MAHLLECESLFKYNEGEQKSLRNALFCNSGGKRDGITKRI